MQEFFGPWRGYAAHSFNFVGRRLQVLQGRETIATLGALESEAMVENSPKGGTVLCPV